MIHEALRNELINAGADIVGFSDLKGIPKGDISHLQNGISIAVIKNLNQGTISLLTRLQKKAAMILKKEGYKYFSIPPDSDRVKGSFISKLYPLFTHKIAATSAGLGWIGRNGLLINPDHGPRLSLATVLTDAPLQAGAPVEFSRCGECTLCVDFCPSKAITGSDWSRSKPFVELVILDNCRSHKKKSRAVTDKPNCGLCINICPYGRKNAKKH
ncbi:MAG: epoxyqueuosine reductase [Nitrospirae bacterium]|nr:epoxyqueuosine reductase [Nitrospirota bacterium]